MVRFPRLTAIVRAFALAALAAVIVAAVRPAGVAGQARGTSAIPEEVLAYPDLILTNGKVLTVDKSFSIAQALAIRDGRVLAVGSNGAIERLRGPKTQRLDLAGRTVIPGIIDTHIHIQDMALISSQKEIGAIEPKFRDYLSTEGGVPLTTRGAAAAVLPGGAGVVGSSVAEVLENIKKVVDRRRPGTWVGIELGSPELSAVLGDKVRRQDLDKIAPNHLLMVHLGGLPYLINTRVAEAIKAFYGYQAEEFEIDSSGLSNGRIDFTLVRSLMADLMIDKPMQSLYPAFKKEMQKFAADGITTWVTSLTPFSFQPVFREIDRRGEMPMRFGYSHAMGVAVFPYAGDFYRRLGDVTDMGSDWFWSAGIGVVHIDGAPCTKLKPSNPCFAAKPGDVKRKALYEAVKYGNRIVGTHVSGDGAVDNLLDIVEEASKAAGMTPEQIRAKGHALDHCTLNPRPDQITRGVTLGVIWSCAPANIENAARLAADYGVEQTHKWMTPVGSILRAGGRVAGEGEVAGPLPEGSYFSYFEALMTRKDSQGRVWGRDEAIDRKDVLRMYTIWSAEYAARSDRLGSLEPGKLADLVVLNRDYMTIPAEEFSELRPVLTMVGGKIVHRSDQAPTSQP